MLVFLMCNLAQKTNKLVKSRIWNSFIFNDVAKWRLMQSQSSQSLDEVDGNRAQKSQTARLHSTTCWYSVSDVFISIDSRCNLKDLDQCLIDFSVFFTFSTLMAFNIKRDFFFYFLFRIARKKGSCLALILMKLPLSVILKWQKLIGT